MSSIKYKADKCSTCSVRIADNNLKPGQILLAIGVEMIEDRGLKAEFPKEQRRKVGDPEINRVTALGTDIQAAIDRARIREEDIKSLLVRDAIVWNWGTGKLKEANKVDTIRHWKFCQNRSRLLICHHTSKVNICALSLEHAQLNERIIAFPY
jgi:hypothetical protein